MNITIPTELFIKITLDDKEVVPFRKSHSLVRNYYRSLMNCTMGMANTVVLSTQVVDTGGTNRENAVGRMFYYDGNTVSVPTNNSTYGIQVGSGSTAEAYTDNKLATQILSGSIAGKLTYATMSLTYGGVAPTKTRTITRTFINNSGGDVSVNEVGYVVGFVTGFAPTTYWYILYARDVLTSTITVADESTLGVQYTFSYTFPT